MAARGALEARLRADAGTAARKGPASVASSTATEDCVCICSMCTCGQHHCPRPVASVPFAGASTYKSDYPSHPICPHHGPVPLQWAPSGVPFEGTSEMRAQYTPKALDPAVLGAAGGSTGEAPSRPRIPFEGTSSYKSDFVAHPLCPLHPPAEGYGGYKPSTVPFEGVSTARESYPRWDLPPREYSAGSGAAPARPHIPFDGKTTAQEAFTAKPLPSAPAPAAYVYQPSTVKFEGVSTSRADFTPKPLERPGPLGPAAGVGAGRPSIPFTGESESRSAYPRWELPAQEYGDGGAPPTARPHIPFEGRSASSEAYTPKALPAYPAVPAYEYRPSTVPFDGSTESKDQYKRWELPAQAPLGPTATARPHIPFEGRTTASEAYTPKPLPAYPGPQAGAGLEYKPMTDCRDFSTEARDTLTWKQPPEDPIKRRWLHNHH